MHVMTLFCYFIRGHFAKYEHCASQIIDGCFVDVGTDEQERILRCTSFFLSLYTARPSFEYYRQVYFVHSGLQDESLQVTISKLP